MRLILDDLSEARALPPHLQGAECLVLVPRLKKVIFIANKRVEWKERRRKFYWIPGSWRKDPKLGWTSVEDLFRIHSHMVTQAWDSELISTEYWMSEHHEGGGLHGVAPEYHFIRENLISMGKQIMKEHAIQVKVERHGNR